MLLKVDQQVRKPREVGDLAPGGYTDGQVAVVPRPNLLDDLVEPFSQPLATQQLSLEPPTEPAGVFLTRQGFKDLGLAHVVEFHRPPQGDGVPATHLRSGSTYP